MNKTGSNQYVYSQSKPLVEYVRLSILEFLSHNSVQESINLHSIVIEQVEKTMIEVVLEKYEYNQSKVSRILGISRSTLRKKIDVYNIIEDRERQEKKSLDSVMIKYLQREGIGQVQDSSISNSKKDIDYD
jgi:Fis family transcriptional regulator